MLEVLISMRAVAMRDADIDVTNGLVHDSALSTQSVESQHASSDAGFQITLFKADKTCVLEEANNGIRGTRSEKKQGCR